MAKNTRKLEKETLEWKTKWEKSNAILIELATEKKERDEHAARCNKQVDQLQKLLRALQNERSHLYKVLRDNNIECPTMPQLPPEPEPMQTQIPTPSSGGASDKDKMEIMSRNCAELKQTLANLQSQMKFLNVNSGVNSDGNAKVAQSPAKQQQTEDTNKKRQRKKQKSKSNKNVKESSPAPDTELLNANTSATTNDIQTGKDVNNVQAVTETESIEISATVSTEVESSADVAAVATVPETPVSLEVAAKAAELTVVDITEAAVATVAELVNGAENATAVEPPQQQEQQILDVLVPN